MFFALRCPACGEKGLGLAAKYRVVSGGSVKCVSCGQGLRIGKLYENLAWLVGSLLSQVCGIYALVVFPKPMDWWMFVPIYACGCVLGIMLALWISVFLLPLQNVRD